MNKRLTHIEFLEKASYASPNVTPLGMYQGYASRVLSSCNACGYQWSPLAGQLMRGVGCPKCARNARLTIEEIRSRVHEKHPNIEISGEYKNQDSRIACKCSTCGYAWETSAASLSNGAGCPKCSGTLKLTNEAFLKRIADMQPNISVLGTYKNLKSKILFRCDECGLEWETTPDSLFSGSGCPKCAGRPPRNTEVFRKQLAEVHPDIELIGEYVNVHAKTRFRHKSCGHEWEADPNGLLNRGRGCPKCGRERGADARRKTRENFVQELAAVNPDVELIGDYKSIHTRTQFKCRKCNNTWNAEPNSVLNAGTGCPECWRGATSYAEQYIRFAFEEAFGSANVVSRDRETIGRELDIFVPDNSLAIEYGAWYWHKNSIKADIDKQSCCKARGIHLITIYDCCPDSASLPDSFLIYNVPLGEKKNAELLKSVVIDLLREAKYTREFDQATWERIEILARRNSGKGNDTQDALL